EYGALSGAPVSLLLRLLLPRLPAWPVVVPGRSGFAGARRPRRTGRAFTHGRFGHRRRIRLEHGGLAGYDRLLLLLLGLFLGRFGWALGQGWRIEFGAKVHGHLVLVGLD